MADLINTPDDDVFKQFVKSQKEKEEAEKLKHGGNGGGEYKGEQVKLGISAPKEVPVYRKEVYVQIQETTKEAAATVSLDALKGLF